MVNLFDTSVLVAALIQSHRNHARSLKILQEVKSGRLKGMISQHTLAELYSSLTNYPSNPRLSATAAESLILENIFGNFQIVTMNSKDYREAIRRVRQRQLRGGVIYDALILQAGIKGRAKVLLTWNLGDFQRLTENEIEVREP